MIQVQHLRKNYGPATVLADITFLINDGEPVALIGPNGAGKSTILRCIVGQEQSDSGTISLSPPGMTIGYLPQAFAELGDRTVGEIVAAAQAELHDAERALGQAAEALAGDADLDAAMPAYESAPARFEAPGGYEREPRAPQGLRWLRSGG